MNESQIPRWVVENSPAWEKSIDSDIGVLKWTRKGSGGKIFAVCSPTSMMCRIMGVDEERGAGLVDPFAAVRQNATGGKNSMAFDITKYLSSRYLNPQTRKPGAGFEPGSRHGFQ